MSAASAPEQKISFLDKPDEKVMLAVPFVLGVFALCVFLGSGARFGFPINQSLTRLLVGLIMLDGIHIIYTVVVLFFIPEVRQWTSVKSAGFFGSFWVKTGLVTVGYAALFFVIHIASFAEQFALLVAAYLFIEGFGPSQHTLAQIKGVSLSYNSALRKAGAVVGEAAAAKALRSERREKRLFMAMLVGDTLTFFDWIRPLGNFPNFGLATSAVGIPLAILAAAGLLINARTFPGYEKSHKFIYLTRVALFPIRMLIAPVSMAVAALHGNEYLMVTRQMIKRSKMSDSRRKIAYAAAVISTLIYIPVMVINFRDVWSQYDPEMIGSTTFLGFAWFHLVLRYVHYYMDRTMFRMTQAHTRAAIGPLLVPNPAAKMQPQPLPVLVSADTAA